MEIENRAEDGTSVPTSTTPSASTNVSTQQHSTNPDVANTNSLGNARTAIVGNETSNEPSQPKEMSLTKERYDIRVVSRGYH